MSPASQSFRFRESRRLLREAPVRLTASGEDAELVARTRDIAVGGMFVATSDVRPAGTAAEFVLELGSGDPPDTVQGEAAVVWVREAPGGADQPAGMGMQFTRVEPPGEERLAMLFSEQPDETAGSDPVAKAAPPATAGGVETETEEVEPVDDTPDAVDDTPEEAVAEMAEPSAVEDDVLRGPLIRLVGMGGNGNGEQPVPVAQSFDVSAPVEESTRPADPPAAVRPSTESTPAPAPVAAEVPARPSEPAARSPEAAASSPEPATRSPEATIPSREPTRRPRPSVPPQSTPAPSAPPANATALRSITASLQDDRTLVEITGNAPFERHHVMLLEAPPRLLVRLIGVQRDYDASAVSAARLRRVRTGVHGRGATRNLHVVLDLAAPNVVATVERRGDRVVVNLSD